MATLEQALLDLTKLSREDLSRAESRRAEMGGRLETALLELGLISERDLAAALASHLNLPAATVENLENVPESVQGLLSGEQAATYLAMPFAAAPGRVDLAIGSPMDLEKADEMAFLLGRRVRFFVLNEVRVAKALHRYYGQAQPARLLNLADRLERGLGPSRDLASEPSANAYPSERPAAGTFGGFGAGGSRSSREPALGLTRRVTPSKPREERRKVELSDAERQAIFGAPREPEPAAEVEQVVQVPASELARLSHELQAARSPTGVGEAFMGYLESSFDSVLLLRPEGELFCGWLALGSPMERSELRQLITGPTLATEWRQLAADAEFASCELGPSAVAAEIHEALSVEAGSRVTVIPVRVQERIVCLALCAPDRELRRHQAELIGNASLRTGLALQSWILRQRTQSNEAPHEAT